MQLRERRVAALEIGCKLSTDFTKHLNFDDAHSTDETIPDQEPGYQNIGASEKQVRQKPLHWRDLELSKILWYADYLFESQKTLPVGNNGHSKVVLKGNQFRFRILDSRLRSRPSQNSCTINGVPTGLPANFYAETFVDALPRADRTFLESQVEPRVSLPDLSEHQFGRNSGFSEWIQRVGGQWFYGKTNAP